MSTSSTESTPERRNEELDETGESRTSSPEVRDRKDSASTEGSVIPEGQQSSGPPLRNEEPPPLPNEAPPGQVQDDGWDPVWDENAQSFYFYNRFTKVSQWDNPRVPAAAEPAPPGVGNYDRIAQPPSNDPPTVVERPAGGYDPAIHGDYDPNADYAKVHQASSNGDSTSLHPPGTDSSDSYAATGAFNRFTGKWQAATLNPENFNDENKSRRQMSAYFDVDAAANSHEGKSLKAERSGKKLSKKELKAFKDKRRERKEEKRRAWLRD
jgi:WW domain